MAKPRTEMSLDELRAAIRTTQAKLAALDAAHLPLDEAEANLMSAVDQLASFYDPAPGLAALTCPDGDLLGTVQLLLPDPRYDPHAAAGFVATLHRDALLALLTARLRALYAADPALAHGVPLAGRAAEAQRLQATLRDLEVQEELLISAAERRGQVIDRRADCDPAVLFAPEVLVAEPAPPVA